MQVFDGVACRSYTSIPIAVFDAKFVRISCRSDPCWTLLIAAAWEEKAQRGSFWCSSFISRVSIGLRGSFDEYNHGDKELVSGFYFIHMQLYCSIWILGGIYFPHFGRPL